MHAPRRRPSLSAREIVDLLQAEVELIERHEPQAAVAALVRASQRAELRAQVRPEAPTISGIIDEIERLAEMLERLSASPECTVGDIAELVNRCDELSSLIDRAEPVAGVCKRFLRRTA